MMKQIDFNTLLVPIDFSASSRAAFAQAIGVVSGDNPLVILLHVIDPSLTEFAEALGFGSHEEITHRMRQRAEGLLQEFVEACPEGIEVDPIISEGRCHNDSGKAATLGMGE